MADEKDKQTHTPDDVSGSNGTYDKDKNTSTGVGAGDDGKDYASVFGTGSIVFPGATAENSAYQDYLKRQGLDIHGTYEQAAKEAQQAYAAQVAANKSAYERQLGTYGAQAEMLAKSGLAASGYSDYLAGQAYATQQAGNLAAQQQMAAQQQSALESAQSTAQEQYANYLSQVNTQAETILKNLQSSGGTISDETKALYRQMGYSDEAITKAQNLYDTYISTPEYAKEQAQGAMTAILQGQETADIISDYGEAALTTAKKDIDEVTDKVAQGISVDKVLSDLGYDTSSMDETQKNTAYQNVLGYASSNTGREAFVKNELEYAKTKSNSEEVNQWQNIADTIAAWAKQGVSQEDINVLTQKILDSIDLASYTEEYIDKKSGKKYEVVKMSPFTFNYGSEKRKEMWHTNSVVQKVSAEGKILDSLPENAFFANINGQLYAKVGTGTKALTQWAPLSGLDKQSQAVLEVVAKLQSVGASSKS